MTALEEYGQLVSSKDTDILQDTALPAYEDTETEITSMGNALWSYKETNTINGIPVAEKDRNLLIDREDLLLAAFELHYIPKSIMMRLDPESTEGLKKYDDLLAAVCNGSVIITEELKQYNPTKDAFLVWIKYSEVEYKLHRRFEYLREESDNAK